jgi:predicted HicB family RNase H-like nuclease
MAKAIKKRYNFRLKPDLMAHVEKQADKNGKTLTEYVERSLAKTSKYKEKELV